MAKRWQREQRHAQGTWWEGGRRAGAGRRAGFQTQSERQTIKWASWKA